VPASSVVDRVVKSNIIKLVFVIVASAKHAANAWLAWNWDNVSEWSDMSTRRLLFHYENPTNCVI
jgi:hypothetical protein